jgi:hypothetical protein
MYFGKESPLKDILFLFSENSIMAVDLVEEKVIHRLEEGFANVLLLDNEYFYSIQNGTANRNPGFYIQNLHTFWDPVKKMIDISKSFKLNSSFGG